MNLAIMMGRLTRDPELRYGQTDVAVARYSLAVDRKNTRGNETDYFNIVSFGRAAEFADKYFKKGMRVLIQGHIQTGSYVNKEGQKVNTFEIVADSQEFADSKGANDG